MKKTSIEQVIRDILEKAINDGLVSSTQQFDDPSPQSRTSGDLVGCANILAEFLRSKSQS